MPYLACNDCHHEFESFQKEEPCDWCGGTTRVPEEETPLEKMIPKLPEMLKDIKKQRNNPKE